MKKLLIILLIMAFTVGILFTGIGCKEESVEEVEEVTEEFEEAE